MTGSGDIERVAQSLIDARKCQCENGDTPTDWRDLAQAAIRAIEGETAKREKVLREALTDARKAIDSLDIDALGWADMSDRYTGDAVGYPIRDELLAKIDAALTGGG